MADTTSASRGGMANQVGQTAGTSGRVWSIFDSPLPPSTHTSSAVLQQNPSSSSSSSPYLPVTENLDCWIELPHRKSTSRPTWREYYRWRDILSGKGKRKADTVPSTQRKRFRQLTLQSSIDFTASSRTHNGQRHGPTSLAQSLVPAIEEVSVLLPSTSKRDRSKHPVADINPLRPYYKHLHSWEYPTDAEKSLFVEPRRPSAYFGDQKWQQTHRITPKPEGLLCPWTLRQKTIFSEAEVCGRAFISVELLLKHVERCHFGSRDERHIFCRWANCSNRTFANPRLLRDHIIERHAPQLGWSCPFQECKLSSSVPRDVWTSESHIEKAHDEIYEPLRPLALPRNAEPPDLPVRASFKVVQPAWTLLLPCPRSSTRQHSRLLPSQLHQPPSAAAGMIGTVPPVLDPGCHPWNVILPILEDLEPNAPPLENVKPSGQECWIDVEVLSEEEKKVVTQQDGFDIVDVALSPSTAMPVSRSVSPCEGIEDDVIDVDGLSLSSGFRTPPVELKRDPFEEAAAMERILVAEDRTPRKEVLVQTDEIVVDGLVAGLGGADPKTPHQIAHHVAASEGSGSLRLKHSPLPLTATAISTTSMPHRSADADRVESREASVQAGRSILLPCALAPTSPSHSSTAVPSHSVRLSKGTVQLEPRDLVEVVEIEMGVQPSHSVQIGHGGGSSPSLLLPPPPPLGGGSSSSSSSSSSSLLTHPTRMGSPTPPPPYTS